MTCIVASDAPALLEFVLNTPLSIEEAAYLAVQAHRSDVRRGVDGLPVCRGGCLTAVFVGTARRQFLQLEAEASVEGMCSGDAEDDDDGGVDGTCIGRMDEAVLVLSTAAAMVDDPTLLDVLMDLECRATVTTRPSGPSTPCEMGRFFEIKRAPRCLARWRSVFAREPRMRLDRIYYRHAHLKRRLETEAQRQLARLSAGCGDDPQALEDADVENVRHGGPNVCPRRLLRQLLRVVAQTGQIEVLPTPVGTSTFGLSLLARSELVMQCEEHDNAAHRALRRLAQQSGEEVDDERALRRLPIEAYTSDQAPTLLSQLLAPLASLRPPEVPVAVLVRCV